MDKKKSYWYRFLLKIQQNSHVLKSAWNTWKFYGIKTVLYQITNLFFYKFKAMISWNYETNISFGFYFIEKKLKCLM